MERFRQTEVDDLRRRFTAQLAHQDVRRFQVTVQDSALVRVINRPADWNQQADPRTNREVALVAIADDGSARDEFHDEERPAEFGRAAVKHRGDIRMIHHRQGLALRFEAGQDLARVHARFDQLDRDLAANGLRLLRQPDAPHPAGADVLEQRVASADDGAGLGLLLPRTISDDRLAAGGRTRSRGMAERLPEIILHEPVGFEMRLEQCLESPPQFRLAGAGRIQESGARVGTVGFQ